MRHRRQKSRFCDGGRNARKEKQRGNRGETGLGLISPIQLCECSISSRQGWASAKRTCVCAGTLPNTHRLRKRMRPGSFPSVGPAQAFGVPARGSAEGNGMAETNSESFACHQLQLNTPGPDSNAAILNRTSDRQRGSGRFPVSRANAGAPRRVTRSSIRRSTARRPAARRCAQTHASAP